MKARRRSKEGDANAYAAACVFCGKPVRAGAGALVKSKPGAWHVKHRGTCATPSEQAAGLTAMGWTYHLVAVS